MTARLNAGPGSFPTCRHNHPHQHAAPGVCSYNGDGDDDATWLPQLLHKHKALRLQLKMFLNMRASFLGKKSLLWKEIVAQRDWNRRNGTD